MPALLTPIEVAEYLSVPIRTLASWRYLGIGPSYVKAGRSVRYTVPDLQHRLSAQRAPLS